MIYFWRAKKLKLLMTTANGLIKTMMKWPLGMLYAPVIRTYTHTLPRFATVVIVAVVGAKAAEAQRAI